MAGLLGKKISAFGVIPGTISYIGGKINEMLPGQKTYAGTYNNQLVTGQAGSYPQFAQQAQAYTDAAAQQQAAVQQQAIDTTGGGGVYAPQYNLADKINALNELYNVIYQDLASMTQEQRKQIEQGYGQQAKTAQTQYEQTARALPLQYGAMGVGDSSYYAKAAGTASDLYQQAAKDIQTQQEAKLAELGKAYEGQRAAFQSAQSQLGGIPQYGSQADVTALEQQLNSLAQQRTNLGTQSNYLGALQNIAPAPTTSASQLETKLQELYSQSVPTFAKQTIAAGQIKQSGLTPDQQAYYTDYFDKLLKQQQPGSTPTVGA